MKVLSTKVTKEQAYRFRALIGDRNVHQVLRKWVLVFLERNEVKEELKGFKRPEADPERVREFREKYRR